MEVSLLELILTRYMIHIFLMIICFIWALIGSEYVSYEPPHRSINIIDSSKWNFAAIAYATSSIREDLWNLGISRTLDQLDSIRKSASPLWRDLDLILAEWELKLDDYN